MNNRWKPSVTVAAVIKRDFDGVQKFLLVEEETRDGLKLNNPAGHMDAGESPLQACVRETLEETAFFLDLVCRPVKPLVLTCAMRPATALLTDGPQNLRDAVCTARWPGEPSWPSRVGVRLLAALASAARATSFSVPMASRRNARRNSESRLRLGRNVRKPSCRLPRSLALLPWSCSSRSRSRQ